MPSPIRPCARPVRVALAWLLAWAVLAAPAAAQAPPAAPPPVETFFGKPLLASASLSPDGRRVAMTVAAPGGRARLAVLELDTMRSTVVAAIADSDIDEVYWLNDQRLVFNSSVELVGANRVDYGPGLWTVDAAGGPLRDLVETRPAGFLASGEQARPLLHWRFRTASVPQRPGNDEVIVHRPEEVSADRVGHFSLLRLDTRTGITRDVSLPPDSEHWVFDAQGQPRAVTTRQGLNQTVHWRESDGRWRQLARFEWLEGQGLVPRFVDADGRLYVEAGHRGRAALFMLDTTTGQLAPAPLASHPQFDIHPRFIEADGRLLGLRYTIDAEVTQWLDPAAKALQAEIDALLTGTVNRLSLPRRGDSPWVLVETFSDQQPLRAWLYHRGSKKLTRLGDSRPAIDARRMATTDFTHYTARDGRRIPAWLTLPPGGQAKNLPLVVWVHGGPWVRGMHWHWHPEVQFLASRGYAVLQPEFRGSTGYGDEHFAAGWKQWGQAMQTDLADGARWAIAQGVADPKRIAILGASYGGYAVLMGLAQEPELFRAGVNWVGVSDIQLMYSAYWSDLSNEWKSLGMPRLIGDPVKDAAMLAANSPLQQAARIRNPLLLAHGAWDSRVPPDHGERMRNALKPHNPQLEWVLYPEEGHGWRRTETQVDFWGRVERFLARNLAVAKAP
jgi:dienelactone hydrolase